MNLCVIPARGGSKRIPRKNIREFCGKPMIARSIEAALASRCFSRVVVSTDDQEVAEISKAFGADVPFLRPAELATDYAATRPVINHAIKAVSSLYEKPDFVCCLYPTAPFVKEEDIVGAFQYLESQEIDFVFSAALFPYPIQRGFRILPGGALERLYPQHRETRSQDLEEVYHDAGQFYWGRSQAFLDGTDVVSEKSRAFVLPRYRVHDIDTEEDWQLAVAVFKAINEHDANHAK